MKIRKPATQPAMNVVPLGNPTARPPIQMKSPKKRAQRNDTTPWAIEGARKCIGRDPNAWVARRNSHRTLVSAGPQKIHRAGGAFVHLSHEPSASAYGPRERLRPTRAPCSVQEGSYDAGGCRARVRRRPRAQFAETSARTARISGSCCVLKRGG